MTLPKLLAARLTALALVGGLVAGGVLLPAEFKFTVGKQIPATENQVQNPTLGLVCPGAAIRVGGADSAELGTIEQVGSAELNAQVSNLADAIDATRLSGLSTQPPTSLGASLPARVASPLLLSATNEDLSTQGSSLLAASQLQLQTADNFSGLLGAQCQLPSNLLEFVGGDSQLSRELLLVLTNPSRAEARAQVLLHGKSGLAGNEVEPITVAPGKTEVVALGAYLSNATEVAVQVKVSGAAVAGWLQQRVMRGTLPGGSDWISPTTTASKSQIVPGIMIRGVKDAREIIKTNANYADQQAVLRVFVPGKADANFTAQIFGSTAKTFGTTVVEKVAAGTVKDFPLTALADGDYAAFIDSDQPIQVAVKLPRTNKSKTPATDFAWLPAQPYLVEQQAFVVPASGISKLSLANGSKDSVELTLGTAAAQSAGVATRIVLPAGSTRVVELVAGSRLVLWSPAGSKVAAMMIVDVDSAVSAIGIRDYANKPETIRVSVR